MSTDSLRKGVYTASLDDDDSDLSLEPVGPKSLAAMREGRSLLKRDEDSLDVEEMGPKSMAAFAGREDLGQETDDGEDSLKVINMGPASMAAFAADQPIGNSKEVKGKLKEGGVTVPQPKPRKKPQEDKHLTDLYAENARLRGQTMDLEQQLERAKRDSDTKAKQQETMIGRLTAQLETKEKELVAATKTSRSKSSLSQELAKKDAELKSLKEKTKAEIERKVAEKDAKRKSETSSLQKEISDLKKQLEELRRLANTREAEKKQLRKEADKLRGQLIKQAKTDNGKTRQAEIDGLMAEVDDLKNQLQIKGAQVKDLNRLASTRGEEKDRLTREVEKLKGELELSRVEEDKTKQVEISRLTAENSDLKRQLQDKNTQIRELNQSTDHHKVEKEQLVKEAENLQGELLTLQQSRTDDGKTKQAEISRLTGEIRDLRGQLQTKSTRIEQLNWQANTHSEEKKLERTVKELRGEVRRMQLQIRDDSRAKHVEMESLNTEIGDLRSQLQIKNAQVEDLSQLASTRGEEKELFENEAKQLQEQVLKMQQVKTSLIEDNQTKIARIEELTKRLTLLSRQLEQQSREIEQLKRAQMEANRAARELRGGDGRHDLVASTPVISNGGRRAVVDDRTCPMCQKSFPELSQQEYERHVQSHF